MEDHLEKLAAAVEAACEDARHKPLSEMVRHVVEAFVDAKMQCPDTSVALYPIAAELSNKGRCAGRHR